MANFCYLVCDEATQQAVAIDAAWDVDGTGSISFDEFVRAVRLEGSDYNESDARFVFDALNVKGNGELTLLEMRSVLAMGGEITTVGGKV